MPEYDAIVLVSFGGPEKREDVIPFLENVLRGRNVPRERLLEVAEHYYHFDGVSPINAHCRELIAALRAELDAHGVTLPIYWGNRNWHPFLEDTVRQMTADGVRNALAIATSAYSSYSSCRQYLEDIARARAAVGDAAPRIDKLRPFSAHPLFPEASLDRVRTAWDSLEPQGASPPALQQAKFTLAEFREQMNEVQRPGSMHDILKKIPGVKTALAPDEDLEVELNRITAIIDAMTPEERANPELIDESNRRRIAQGGGVDVSEVDELLKQFKTMQDMLSQIAGMKAVAPARRPDTVHLVFTAHSIPLSMARTCSYESELRELAGSIVDALDVPSTHWSLVYQSRSGRPEDPWLEPDVLDHLRDLASQGIEDVVVMPLGFLSDHMEVLYDLDVEAADLCRELGLNMVRAQTVGTHPWFVRMLRELVQERLSGPADECAADCCPTPRRAASRQFP